MFLRSLPFAVAIAVFTLQLCPVRSAEGQDRPRFFVDRQGPRQNVEQLIFSNDSQRLLACGFDKSVHVWDVGANAKSSPEATDKIAFVKSLRWEIARGIRGVIRCLAVAPKGDELAIAGYSARAQPGDIILMREGDGSVIASLPTPAARAQNVALAGHTRPVLSLDFSPSGNRLISSDLAGEVIVWTSAGNRENWTRSQLFAEEGGDDARQQIVRFLSEDEVLVVRPRGDQRIVQRVDVQTKSQNTVSDSQSTQVGALAVNHDRTRWMHADWNGNVRIRRAVDDRVEFQFRTRLPIVLDAAWGPHDLLAIVSSENSQGKGAGLLELWDAGRQRALDQVTISNVSRVRAVAISPDGQRLATHSEDSGETLVYRLRDDDGNLLAKPLSDGTPARVSGRHRELEKLSIAADGSGVTFNRVNDPQRFLLEYETGTVQALAKPMPSIEVESHGWQPTIDAADGCHVLLKLNNVVAGTIRLHPTDQGPAQSACLVPDAQGNPIAVALGTSNSNGVFVYSLPRDGESPRLLRYLRDHADSVVDLVATTSGDLLVSASDDQTLKLWSLRRLDWSPAEFPNASHWGAVFAIQAGKVRVAELHPDGVAAARGLEVGDVIDRIQGYDANDSQRIIDAVFSRVGAEQTLATLDAVSVLKQNLIQATSVRGVKKAFVIVPAWEPLVSVVVDYRDEWAIWAPRGYFNASAADGGDLFGWQINQGQDKTPRILKGSSFQKEFERPTVIQRILQNATIQGALAGIDTQASIGLTASQIPKVRIVAPAVGSELKAGSKTQIVAEIVFPQGASDGFDVRGEISGQSMGAPVRISRAGATHTYTWSVSPREDLNRIRVFASERNGALRSLFAEDIRQYRGEPAKSDPYRLHVLALASEDYALSSTDGNRSGFAKLEFPIDDVSDFVKSLQEKQRQKLGRFTLGDVIQLEDDEITRQSVRDAIDRLIQNRTQDDVILVYLAGHGTTEDGRFYYVTTQVKTGDSQDIRSRGLPWDELERISRFQGRVIWLIDTCHSGSVVDAKSSVRSAKSTGNLVFAAATGGAAAFEYPALKHGVFSYCVLQGLDGKADGALDASRSDGEVFVDELIGYVKQTVMEITGAQQRPVATPAELQDLILPLVRVE